MVERRSVRFHLRTISIPYFLYLMRHCPPGSQRPTMNFQMRRLSRRGCPANVHLLPKIDLSVTVYGRDIPGRTEDITDQHRWFELCCHSNGGLRGDTYRVRTGEGDLLFFWVRAYKVNIRAVPGDVLVFHPRSRRPEEIFKPVVIVYVRRRV